MADFLLFALVMTGLAYVLAAIVGVAAAAFRCLRDPRRRFPAKEGERR